MSQKRNVRVVAAIVYHREKVLICRRSPNGDFPNQWEFPGGKVNQGEGDEEALKRETLEELGVDCRVKERMTELFHDYPNIHVTLAFYVCEIDEIDEIKNYVHPQIRWVKPTELKEYDFLEADLPVLEMLTKE